jgi:uncharacterized protein
MGKGKTLKQVGRQRNFAKSSIKIIERFMKKMESVFKIEKVIFFGSRARGERKKDSDIDLIIVSKDFEGMDSINRSSKMYDYWDYLVPVDFICLTKKEYDKLRKKITIVRGALIEGIVVK